MLNHLEKILEAFRPKPSKVLLAKDSIRSAAAAAETFDISPVLKRYREETGVDEKTACRHWRELSRFLIMVGHLPDRGYGMFGPVDDLWHAFVLHSRSYRAFCETQSGRFVHAQPGTTARDSGWRSRYLQFLIDYRLVFGHPPPDESWPLPNLRSLTLPVSAAEIRYGHVKAMEQAERGSGRSGEDALSKVESRKAVGALIDLGSGSQGGDGGGCGGSSG